MGWEQARPSRPAYRPARKYVPAQWVGIRERRQARILACWAGYVLPLKVAEAVRAAVGGEGGGGGGRQRYRCRQGPGCGMGYQWGSVWNA